MPNYDASYGQGMPSVDDPFKMDWGAGKNYNPLQLNTSLAGVTDVSPKFSLLPGGGAFGENGNPVGGIGAGQQLGLMDPNNMNWLNQDYNLDLNDISLGGQEPDAVGGWLQPAKFGLGAAKVGTGIYNALQSSKMNKFMRNYYGDQMDLQKADFANSARSTNTALEGQRERQLDAQGYAAGSDENKSRVDDYMQRHGVDERA